MLTTTLFLSALAAVATAQEDPWDHAQAVCFPLSNPGTYDLQAPCNAFLNLEKECRAGSPQSPGIPGCDGGGTHCMYNFNNATQRACICGSQYFDQLKGCKACFFSHGVGDVAWEGSFPESPDAISSAYCAVKSEPTLAFHDVFDRYGEGGDLSASPTFATDGNAPEPTWSDPIGNKTDPALYFTPAVTGTDAYHVALHTVTPSSDWSLGSSIRISYSTSNGYFVPTAAPNNKAGASGPKTSGTGTTASGTSASGSTTSSSGSATGSSHASAASDSAKGSATMSGMAVQQTAAIAGMLAIGALAIAL